MTATTLNGINLLNPISIANELNLAAVDENALALNTYVFEEFRKWGLVPFSKTLFPVQKNSAYYPSKEKLTQSIVWSYFFSFVNKDFGKPSKEKLDASFLAIRMGYPGQLGRSGLNAYVVGELKKLGLSPNQGRHGAIGLGLGLNIFDGGVYPVNNPIIRRIIRNFFEDLASQGFNSEVEKYAISISA
jgi:hypothetical protein